MSQKHLAILDFDDVKNPLLGAGQAWATHHVGKRLAKRGYEITVLTSKYPGYKDRRENGIRYIHIGLGTKNIKINNAAYFFAVPYHVMRLKVDLIIECFTAPISTMFSPLFTKVPVIGLPSMFNAYEFTKKYHLPFHWIEKLGIKLYKNMIAYSDVDNAKIRSLNRNAKVKIIPQGVDEYYFKLPHHKPKHILFLSRFDIKQKGIDLLLKAYAKIADQTPYPLVIAGHGPDEMKIRSLAGRLGIKEKVIFAGSAYGKKKARLMSNALCVAFPSRHDEMCLWTLEALAAGLPIVCFDLPESKWIADQAVIKVPKFEIDAYSQALLKLEESNYNSALRIRAKTFARKFSWDYVTQQFDIYLNEVYDKNQYSKKFVRASKLLDYSSKSTK